MSFLHISEQKAWFWGLSLVSWISWWGSTVIGVYGGQALSAYPLMNQMMNFAFAALFISLTTHSYHKHKTHRPAMIVAIMVALACALLGHGEMAILLAALVAFFISLLQTSQKS